MTEEEKLIWKELEKMGWSNEPKNMHLEYFKDIIKATKKALDISAVSCSLPSKKDIILQARKEENYIGNENDIEGAEKTGKYHGFLRGVEWLSDKLK